MILSKSELRKLYLFKRSKISLQDRQKASVNAANIFANLSSFKESQNIACYLSFKDEFETAPLIETIWQAKKKCYIPILCSADTDAKKALKFVHYQYGDPLRLNRYSILEPVKVDNQLSAKDLDMVITPLVVFDLNGNRIGMGAGYYDTTFAFLKNSETDKPELYGLAFSEQLAPILPHDSWDIRLNGIITEKEFIYCKNNK